MDFKHLALNNHQSSVAQVLSSSRTNTDFCDMTLASNGILYQVHKLVLASCSEYFTQLLQNADEKQPYIVLADISSDVVEKLLDYMYNGQVYLEPANIPELLKAADSLKIRGLFNEEDTKSAYSEACRL